MITVTTVPEFYCQLVLVFRERKLVITVSFFDGCISLLLREVLGRMPGRVHCGSDEGCLLTGPHVLQRE